MFCNTNDELVFRIVLNVVFSLLVPFLYVDRRFFFSFDLVLQARNQLFVGS